MQVVRSGFLSEKKRIWLLQFELHITRQYYHGFFVFINEMY